jgi:hypothetical protein
MNRCLEKNKLVDREKRFIAILTIIFIVFAEKRAIACSLRLSECYDIWMVRVSVDREERTSSIFRAEELFKQANINKPAVAACF